MKLYNMRFLIFEALAFVASLLTAISLSPFGNLTVHDYLEIALINCLPSFLIGQAIAWKVFKRGGGVAFGFLIYATSTLVLIAELIILSLADYFMYAEERAKAVEAGYAYGFTFASLSFVIFFFWLALALIPSLISGLLASAFKLIPRNRNIAEQTTDKLTEKVRYEGTLDLSRNRKWDKSALIVLLIIGALITVVAIFK